MIWGNTFIAKKLIQYSANLNIQTFERHGAYTALMICCKNGHDEIASILIKNENINMNMSNSQGLNALLLCIA